MNTKGMSSVKKNLHSQPGKCRPTTKHAVETTYHCKLEHCEVRIGDGGKSTDFSPHVSVYAPQRKTCRSTDCPLCEDATVQSTTTLKSLHLPASGVLQLCDSSEHVRNVLLRLAALHIFG